MQPTPPVLTSRGVYRKTKYLQSVLDEGTYSHDELWLAALKRFATDANTHGQFDDLTSSEHFASVDCNDVDNVLIDSSIAEISVLYEFLLAHDDMTDKRAKGQFFTPDDVAEFMASKATEFEPGIWMDPCCGVGNLSYWLIAAQEDPEHFLIDNIVFADTDERALLTARTVLTILFQATSDNLFTLLEPNFRHQDFLSGGLLESSDPVEYDYVIMNPPYVQTAAHEGRFASSASRDLFAFFMERALNTSKGVVCITPQTFTNGRRHRQLRRVILTQSSDCKIYCFDNVPDTIFRGFKFGSENTNQVNSTRAAILVASCEAAGDGTKDFSITPLVRWASAQRKQMFQEVDGLLAHPRVVTDEVFPKVLPGLEDLYDEMNAMPLRIRDVVEHGGRTRVLNVPTTPRYFISAVQRQLSRSSFTVLPVADEHWQLAYLMLNSSLTYLWWRALDGGMTLSKSTLMSMPLSGELDLHSPEASALVARLEESERTNVVTKLNSGKLNENVKHPLELVDSINRFLAPSHADLLLTLHSNTAFC